MHIPDGFLGPKTCLVCFAAVAPFWMTAWRGLRRKMEMSFEVPYVALASAFVFVLMMFNLPIPGGTSGHPVGTAIVAVAIGVGPAILALSFALAVQALLFQDGGVTAFGANVLTMGVVQALVAAGIWRCLAGAEGKEAISSRRALAAGFAAGYCAALASAAVTGLLLGVQPLVERGADGAAAYFPLGLQVTLPAMMAAHLFVGVVEGAVTGFSLGYLRRTPYLPGYRIPEDRRGGGAEAQAPLIARRPALVPDFMRRRSFWAVSAAFLVAVPLGIWLPAAVKAAEPWGEWTAQETAAQAGLNQVPAGLGRLDGIWEAPVPDYAFGAPAGPVNESIQYIGAAFLGVAVVTLFFTVVGWWFRRQINTAP